MSKKLAPVLSICDLRCKAAKNPAYQKLAIDSAVNLGGPPDVKSDHWRAISFLEDCVSDSGDEDGVVEEINFCRGGCNLKK